MKKIFFFSTSALSFWDDSLQKFSLIDPYIELLTNYAEIKTFSDNSTVTDVGLVIYQKEKNKFYKRIFQDSVKVKWFEANGGGNVGDLGTDDTNIKKTLLVFSYIYKSYALTKRQFFGRFTLYFSKGTYIINELLKIPYFWTIVGKSRCGTVGPYEKSQIYFHQMGWRIRCCDYKK